MNFNEYQTEAIKFKRYPDGAYYPLLALGEEVGELQGKYAKALRAGTKVDKLQVAKEAGDVLWDLSALLFEMGLSLGDVAEWNLAKLADRDKRGVIVGEGDER